MYSKVLILSSHTNLHLHSRSVFPRAHVICISTNHHRINAQNVEKSGFQSLPEEHCSWNHGRSWNKLPSVKTFAQPCRFPDCRNLVARYEATLTMQHPRWWLHRCVWVYTTTLSLRQHMSAHKPRSQALPLAHTHDLFRSYASAGGESLEQGHQAQCSIRHKSNKIQLKANEDSEKKEITKGWYC